jgi:undecaprenyl diphosphate synthase
MFIRRDLARLHRQGVRIQVIGSREGLPKDIAALIGEAEAKTAANTGLCMVVAFNYGGRNEITRAARRIARKVAEGGIDPDEIDETMFAAHLDTSEMPDPDLVIRTSGEMRLSNFLLWQSAYSEFVFLPIHWPDFDENALQSALAQFSSRSRRFGGNLT